MSLNVINQSLMASNTIRNKLVDITYRDDGILHINYKEKIYSLEEAKETFYIVREHCPWKLSPLLISGSLFTNFEANAKTFLSSYEVMQYYSGVAFISKTLGQVIAANFFIRVNKPQSPTKAFNTESKAIKWLSQFETKELD